MHYFSSAALVLSLIFGHLNPASAQELRITVHGIPITCTASNGQPVPFYFHPAAAQAARAMGGARADATPRYGFTIAIDPQYIQRLPRLGALLVVYHECAHVALPMGVGLMSPAQERNADCYAVRAMRAHGLINNWNDFQESMSAIVVSGGGHRVDQARILNMANCIQNP